ncbi:hypothetical protein K443DRAFT_657113 [Laccaria amethystina LaAM-08-1]|uniref:Uncharacterized protein n=1 Tax=Laccaria amethystina LaAM-08-1 TaxID=1095629 RepID=A0A0C9WU01_9AGAR|nr:hypothetical protein K443DRAFT_657113 [Laccaria amethystina LaAM-08-1]
MPNLVLDDRHPAIQYSPFQWGQAGSQFEYNFTNTWTSSLGATAKIRFSGTDIGAYGTIGPKYSGQDPISLYTLDNNSPTTYHGKAEANSQYRILFFQSPALRSGIHELTVTNAAEGVVFFLDYFLVNSLDTTASLSSSHQQSKTVDLATLAVTQDTSSTGVTGSVHSAIKGIRRTALVGGLTGLFVIAFVMLGCFLNTPRRRRLVGKNHTYCGPGSGNGHEIDRALLHATHLSLTSQTNHPKAVALCQPPVYPRQKRVNPPDYASPISQVGIPDIRDSTASLHQIFGHRFNGMQAAISLAYLRDIGNQDG